MSDTKTIANKVDKSFGSTDTTLNTLRKNPSELRRFLEQHQAWARKLVQVGRLVQAGK